MTGGVRSCTLTVNVADALLPCASLAVQTTVLKPTEKVEPDGSTHDAATVPSTRSLADTEYVTAEPAVPEAPTTIGSGTEIVGGVRSRTATWN